MESIPVAHESFRSVPALRFKGFEGEWVCKKVGIISELTSSKRVYLSDYVEKGIPFYRGKEITELRQNITPADVLYISEATYNEFRKKYGVPKKDDILVTAVGTLGNVLRIKNDNKFYFKDGNLIWFRKISEVPSFLEILLEVKKAEIEKTSIGSTQRALTMVELRKLSFPFPSLSEQQQIASFLSTIDEKVRELKLKKELLEQYKKGVMQQLFSGRLRFRDENGKEHPVWEEKTLREIADVIDPHPSHRAPEAVRNGIPFIGIGDISTDGIVDFTSVRLVADDTYEEHLKRYKIELGDFAYGRVASIGKVVVLDRCIKMRYSFSPTLVIIKPRVVNSWYIRHYMQSENFIQIVQGKTTGSTRKSLGVQSLRLIDIRVPAESEQKQIADCLSAIDTRIGIVTSQITQSQAFKKGLLQQMFV